MKTQFWVIVEAKRWYPDRITSLHGVLLRQSKPKLGPDQIAVRITLDIDTKAFTEPIYSVETVVPPELAVPGPAITIETPPEEVNP